MEQFGGVMRKCLDKVALQKAEQMALIEEKHKSNQIDEQDLDQVHQDLDKLTGVAVYINECCDILMTVYGKDAAPILDQNVKFYFAGVMQSYQHVSDQEL